jgi:hypothetical protein
MMDSTPNFEQKPHKVSLIQFTEAEVEETILSMDERKGPAPDDISPSIVKKSA